MFRQRRLRIRTAFLVVWALLFSQLALASYLCPRQAEGVAMAAMMKAGVPCSGMDASQPVLCHQHAMDPAQSFEAAKLPAVFPPALLQVLELPLALDGAEATAAQPAHAAEAHPPPNPLFLATLRLRV